MNFIKLVIIMVTIISCQQYTSCSEPTNNMFEKIPNQDIYDRFAQFLFTKLTQPIVYQYILEAQAVSNLHMRKREFILNIAAIKFSRMTPEQQKNLPTKSMQQLLDHMNDLKNNLKSSNIEK